jgi:glycosyltransferase 2 family protein
MGSTSQALPFGPTTLLQFATCYVNLAVPSSAGKVAITTRFYQRFGIPPAAAVSAGLIDSVSELIVQAALFLCVFFISDIDLGLSFSQDQLSGLATTALIVVGVLLAAIGIGVAVPSLRARMLTTLQDAREALRVLRSPRKLVQLYGGNLLSQVLFAITLDACVHAFGMDVPLTSLILINTVVSLFAGLLPVPGGVGVSEAGLSLGLTRAGIPADMAFAIALSYRFAVFYLPPLWGYLSFKWLTQRRYL